MFLTSASYLANLYKLLGKAGQLFCYSTWVQLHCYWWSNHQNFEQLVVKLVVNLLIKNNKPI